MVEISKKYRLGIRRFDSVNWIGFWTLYKKEVLRFLIVWVQTLLSPIITSLLFLMVLAVAIGGGRSDMLGFPFITFLAPGLIAMQIIQQAFYHSSSSFMIGKSGSLIVSDTILGNAFNKLFCQFTLTNPASRSVLSCFILTFP